MQIRSAGGDDLLQELLPRRIFPWLEQLVGEGEVVAPVVNSQRGQNIWGGCELRGYYAILPQVAPFRNLPLYQVRACVLP